MDEIAEDFEAVFLFNWLFLEQLGHDGDSVSKFFKLLIALSFVRRQLVELVLRILVIGIELFYFQKQSPPFIHEFIIAVLELLATGGLLPYQADFLFEDPVLLEEVLVLLAWFDVTQLLVHLLVDLLLVLKFEDLLELALGQLLQFKNDVVFLVFSAEYVIHLLHRSFIFVDFPMKLLILLHQMVVVTIVLAHLVLIRGIFLLVGQQEYLGREGDEAAHRLNFIHDQLNELVFAGDHVLRLNPIIIVHHRTIQRLRRLLFEQASLGPLEFQLQGINHIFHLVDNLVSLMLRND